MIVRVLMILGALLVFGGVNWQMQRKEHLRASGQTILLDLAPVDPRSLVQGDYMALNFQVARDIGARWGTREDPGTAILLLNDHGIATFSRLDGPGTLLPNEVRLRFRIRRGAVWIGTNAFFFQEGEAERYRDARYGEFRVSPEGEAMLVGLRGAFTQQLLTQPG
jgi:uncharacterized membrane-anchored protein